MDRVYNFSAGPSMLPLEVLERAQAEMLCYGDSGMSVMEMSHRTPEFEQILHDAEDALRKLMAGYGFTDIVIGKDLSGRDRYASAALV